MATICTNQLTVSGDAGTIRKLKQLSVKRNIQAVPFKFTFDKLFPCPLIGRSNAFNGGDVHDWYWDNWGTTAIFPDCNELEDTGSLYKIEFTSEFTPPIRAIRKVSCDYPGLLFVIKFRCEDSNFSGENHYKNGVLVLAEMHEVDEDDQCDYEFESIAYAR